MSTTKRYFLSYKFTGIDIEQLFQEIDPIRRLIQDELGQQFFCNLYDEGMYQLNAFTPRQIMRHALNELSSSTHCLVYVTEYFGGGSAMEVGYALAMGLPIIALLDIRAGRMTSLKAMADKVIYFDTQEDLLEKLKKTLE